MNGIWRMRCSAAMKRCRKTSEMPALEGEEEEDDLEAKLRSRVKNM